MLSTLQVSWSPLIRYKITEHLTVDYNGKSTACSDKSIKLLFTLTTSPIKYLFNIYINPIKSLYTIK